MGGIGGGGRMMTLCKLLLLFLAVMDLSCMLQPTSASILPQPASPVKRHKKSISEARFASSSEEEDEMTAENDGAENERGDGAQTSSSEEEDEEEGEDEDNSWPDSPLHSVFRERQVAALRKSLNKRSASKHKSFFSERQRAQDSKRPKRKHVALPPRAQLGASYGPDPSRAHALYRPFSRRNTQLQHQHQKWHPAAYEVLPDLEVDFDDDDSVVVPLSETKRSKSGDFYYYTSKADEDEEEDDDDEKGDEEEDERDYGLETSREDEEEAIDAALKHLAWQRLTNHLMHVREMENGDERRRKMHRRSLKKRSSPQNFHGGAKSELEAILADDKTAVKLKRSFKDGGKKNESVVPPKNDTAPATTTKQPPREAKTKEKVAKGKLWVPYDSEHTLRSKKSWDQYFGVDKKRSIHDDNDDDDDEEEEDGKAQKMLQDDVLKWYFDKVLLKSSLPLQSKEAEDEDKKKKKMKKAEGSSLKWQENNEAFSKKMEEHLKQMEESLLAGATKILEKEMANKNADKKEVDEAEREVITRLRAAFSLEKMRDAFEDFEESISDLNEEDDEEEDEKKKKMKKRAEEDDATEGEKKKKNSMAKRVIEPTEMAMAFAAHRANGLKDLSSEVASPVYLSDNSESAGEASFQPCPLVVDALGYCEDLSEALGEVGKVLSKPCVQHMLCYTCGDSAGSCNTAFLSQVEEICDDDFRCQATAGAMRSVFLSNHDEFRRRKGDLCRVDQCVAHLPLKKKKK